MSHRDATSHQTRKVGPPSVEPMSLETSLIEPPPIEPPSLKPPWRSLPIEPPSSTSSSLMEPPTIELPRLQAPSWKAPPIDSSSWKPLSTEPLPWKPQSFVEPPPIEPPSLKPPSWAPPTEPSSRKLGPMEPRSFESRSEAPLLEVPSLGDDDEEGEVETTLMPLTDLIGKTYEAPLRVVVSPASGNFPSAEAIVRSSVKRSTSTTVRIARAALVRQVCWPVLLCGFIGGIFGGVALMKSPMGAQLSIEKLVTSASDYAKNALAAVKARVQK